MTRGGSVAATAATDSPGWSSSDPAHWCLRDRARTEAFLAAIGRTVRPGDAVVEAGAGSGILSLAAAAAGAATVVAVELDPLLAGCLPLTAALNGFAERITAVLGNAATADLPRPADVVIAELIDTGLIDERQVAVLNAFHARGVIGPRTRLIPERYATQLELVEVDDRFYGYRIAAPIHDWPAFHPPAPGWHPLRLRPLTERAEVVAVDFARPVEPRVERRVVLTPTADGLANGLRLTGVADLGSGLRLGATNALNGPKVLRLAEPVPVRAGAPLAGRIAYAMGGGLGTVRWRREG
jgi:hypothetical protein